MDRPTRIEDINRKYLNGGSPLRGTLPVRTENIIVSAHPTYTNVVAASPVTFNTYENRISIPNTVTTTTVPAPPVTFNHPVTTSSVIRNSGVRFIDSGIRNSQVVMAAPNQIVVSPVTVARTTVVPNTPVMNVTHYVAEAPVQTVTTTRHSYAPPVQTYEQVRSTPVYSKPAESGCAPCFGCPWWLLALLLGLAVLGLVLGLVFGLRKNDTSTTTKIAAISCPAGKVSRNGACVARCGAGFTFESQKSNNCVSSNCSFKAPITNQLVVAYYFNGSCQTANVLCPTFGQDWDPNAEKCYTVCPEGFSYSNGRICRKICPANQGLLENSNFTQCRACTANEVFNNVTKMCVAASSSSSSSSSSTANVSNTGSTGSSSTSSNSSATVICADPTDFVFEGKCLKCPTGSSWNGTNCVKKIQVAMTTTTPAVSSTTTSSTAPDTKTHTNSTTTPAVSSTTTSSTAPDTKTHTNSTTTPAVSSTTTSSTAPDTKTHTNSTTTSTTSTNVPKTNVSSHNSTGVKARHIQRIKNLPIP